MMKTFIVVKHKQVSQKSLFFSFYPHTRQYSDRQCLFWGKCSKWVSIILWRSFIYVFLFSDREPSSFLSSLLICICETRSDSCSSAQVICSESDSSMLTHSCQCLAFSCVQAETSYVFTLCSEFVWQITVVEPYFLTGEDNVQQAC